MRARTGPSWLLLLVLLWPAVAAGPLSAQPAPPPGPGDASRGAMSFYADVATRLDSAGVTQADILVEIPYTSLRFVREGPLWAARFDVTVVIYDRGNNQVNGDLWTIPIRTRDPNKDQSDGLVFRRRFPMPIVPGRLRFDIRVSQAGSGRGGEWSSTLDVPRYDAVELVFSRPLFGRCDVPAAEIDTAWADGSFVPTVRRRYGDSQPTLCVQGEIYDKSLATDATYTIGWQVLAQGDDPLLEGMVQVPRVHERGAWRIETPLDSLATGHYRLRLTTRLGRGETVRDEPFQVDESRLNIRTDTEMIRGVLSYISGNDELVILDALPPDSLAGFWTAFWERRDPSPGTPKNENLVEFMRRLEYVNTNFSIIDPGWKSDMGRTYIRYGPPDEVEKVPFSGDGPPRETWYYRARGLRFLFVDTEGFGRYRLTTTPRQ